MSWQVEGRVIHNYHEYQSALHQRDTSQAREEAAALRRQAESHQQKVRDAERRVAEAQGNLAEQSRANQELRGHLDDLRRVQSNMASAQAEMQAAMDQEYAQLRQEFSGDVARIDEEHRAHAEAIRHEFDEARQAVDQKLADAEQRRQETEARLKSRIEEVDGEAKADRARKVARDQGDAKESIGLADFTQERRETLRDREVELDLHAQAGAIDERLVDVRRLVEQGRPETALAVANSTYSDARALEKEATRRAAVLDAARSRIVESVAELTRLLDDPEVEKYFATEAARARGHLKVLESRVPEAYARFGQVEAQATRDLDALRRIERQVLAITVAAPRAKTLYEDRERRVFELLRKLRTVKGPISRVVPRLFDAKDPKSARIVECDFGGEKLDLHIPLDPTGAVQVEGYGHATDGECSQSARESIQGISEMLKVRDFRADPHARDQPLLREKPATDHWTEIRKRLDEMEGTL